MPLRLLAQIAQIAVNAPESLVSAQWGVIVVLAGVVGFLAKRLDAAKDAAKTREVAIQAEKLVMKDAQIADRDELNGKLLAMHEARIKQLTIEAGANITLATKLVDLERQLARGEKGPPRAR